MQHEAVHDRLLDESVAGAPGDEDEPEAGPLAYLAQPGDEERFRWVGSGVLAACGVASFLAAMTVGRLGGDHIRQRIAAAPLVRGACLLAAAGLGTALLIGHPIAALAGFALLGLGLSVTLPVILGEAAHRAAANGASPAAVAQVSTVAYLGSFLGPGAMGILVTVTSLETALLLPVASATVAALGAGLLASRRGERTGRQPHAGFVGGAYGVQPTMSEPGDGSVSGVSVRPSGLWPRRRRVSR